MRRRVVQASSFSRSVLRLFCVVLGFVVGAVGQQSDNKQSRPEAGQSTEQDRMHQEQPEAAFVGYVTNGSFIFPDIATSPGPLTNGEKFKLFVNQSISPPYLVVAAGGAAFDQARDVPEHYGQGWGAYGGRFGSSLARASSSSFFGTFLFAALRHEDPRFFPQSNPSFWRSLKHSTKRVFTTRMDSGRDGINSSGLLGPLASEVLANAYLPSSEQTVGRTLSRFGVDLAWRVGGNMFKDYWPTFFREMGLNRLRVIPDPSAPQSQHLK